MLGHMHYNKTATSGFTDNSRERCTAAVGTCPVCLLRFDAGAGTLPDGTSLPSAEWQKLVCHTIKDNTVNGGFQGGCSAHAFGPF
jgi:hypothetical protein